MEGNRDEVFKMQISKPLDDDTVTMAIFYIQFFVSVFPRLKGGDVPKRSS